MVDRNNPDCICVTHRHSLRFFTVMLREGGREREELNLLTFKLCTRWKHAEVRCCRLRSFLFKNFVQSFAGSLRMLTIVDRGIDSVTNNQVKRIERLKCVWIYMPSKRCIDNTPWLSVPHICSLFEICRWRMRRRWRHFSMFFSVALKYWVAQHTMRMNSIIQMMRANSWVYYGWKNEKTSNHKSKLYACFDGFKM